VDLLIMLLSFILGCGGTTTVDFDPGPLSLSLQRLSNSRFDNPVLLTHAPDDSGRIFVLEKMGKIKVLNPDGNPVSEPYLNIIDRVDNSDLEAGLLGLAFDPKFSTQPRVYIYYISRPKGRSSDRSREAILSRYTLANATETRIDPKSEEILLTIKQPDTNHNGGMLTFGPDKMLYLGLGDGGGRGDSFGNGQNTNSLLGSILRLDVTGKDGYQVPSDNPWVGQQEQRPEIWAMGLRNPWRFYFHPSTNDLYIGDVGESHMEELSIRKWKASGVPNYGWPIMEGTQCYPEPNGCDESNFIKPILAYPHREGNCAIIGGPIYNGSAIPELKGVGLYGDYCSGSIWGVWPTSDGWQTGLLLTSNSRTSSFGLDANGEVLVADLNGYVFRLTKN
jgi:glucose/arabinose dehydrogenase